MDFWSRLIGTAYTPKKAAARPAANDPAARLARFKRVYNNVLELCNRPRNLATEGPLLHNLHLCLDRLATLLREESRAPVPHSCLQFAGGNQIYAVIARAATVSQYEPIIRSGVAVFAALVDSEEEDFLASGHFAKSLMRLVRKVLESGNVLVDAETETAILELLFTIAAKIRLQPEILPVWFHSTAKPELEDAFIKEKKTSFVGITQKDDFPLCYLLIDRVHHEGRIGDFARTGLLYVFEATGRSVELQEWVINSDLSTLMASGLGALYSQLSRELSILHPDATLPAVLAMSDYTTQRATAESAFSDRHKAHMSTFLSYLAFWQDVLDHCRSADVRRTLLDHFQILFLQQLLYPSLLQSSDTDAGSSVAVLTYMTTMLEALEYPDLIHMMLTYLLAIQDQQQALAVPATTEKSAPAAGPQPSPTSVRRRQSLMLLSASPDADDAVDPNLFNLVDLIINNLISHNSQSVFAALKLSSTVLIRQKKYAFGTLLKVQTTTPGKMGRTVGALEVELEEYGELAVSLHRQYGLDVAYQSLCEDMRHNLEAQLLLKTTANAAAAADNNDETRLAAFLLPEDSTFMRTLMTLLRTFLTNSVEVNLALTQALISIAQCIDIRLEGWLALHPSAYRFSAAGNEETSGPMRSWQTFLDSDAQEAWFRLQHAARRPTWVSEGDINQQQQHPMLYRELRAVAQELDTLRSSISNIDQLLSSRKKLLQAPNLDAATSELPSMANSPAREPAAFLTVPLQQQQFPTERRSRSPSPSKGAGNERAANRAASRVPSRSSSQQRPESAAPSPSPSPAQQHQTISPNNSNTNSNNPIFQPPPPETPSTTDVLMQQIELPLLPDSHIIRSGNESGKDIGGSRTASLNHILTNAIVLQEFVLELVAVLQVRAAVLGEREVCVV